MKKLVTLVLLPAVCCIAIVVFVMADYATDLRDWLGSDTWAATQSTHFAISPKTSRVQYSYVVNGQEFTGYRSHFFYVQGQDPRWTEWMLDHRESSQVTVYYDPDAPARSVLVPDVSFFTAFGLPIMMAFCLGIIAFPLVLWGGFWVWFRRKVFD